MVLPRNLIALVPMKGIGCSLSERLGSKDVPDEAWPIPKLWHLGTLACMPVHCSHLSTDWSKVWQLAVHFPSSRCRRHIVGGVLCIGSGRTCTNGVGGGGELLSVCT